MATTNKTRYALLGVLCMKSCSGYDIKKFCDKTISHFWNENFGHIYPVLKQLLAERLIRQEENESTDRRKLYSITPEGRQVFYDWLVQSVELQPPRSELLLKLSFGNHMPREKVLEMMGEVKERNTRNLANYRIMETSYQENEPAKKDPAYPYWLASLRFGILSAETAIRWCEETVILLESFQTETITEV